MTEVESEPETRRRRSTRPRRFWLEGGSSVKAWDFGVVGLAAGLLGLGLMLGLAAESFLPEAWQSVAASLGLWLSLALAIVLAFGRSVPRGLLRLRAVDLVLGMTVGIVLRLVAGVLEGSAQGGLGWPTIQRSEPGWVLTEVAGPALIGPVLEEFFFHAVLLVALYTVLRRGNRSHLVPGVAAALITTGLFVMAHVATSAVADSWAGPVSLALVGLAGAALVLLTGRIWAAVLCHVVFNGSYVALALVGTVAGGGSGSLGMA